MRPLLIVKSGRTLPELARRRGDYEDWISAGMGLEPARIRIAHVYENAPLPGPDALAGVVVTGSSAMVSHREPWSERTAAWLGRRRARRHAGARHLLRPPAARARAWAVASGATRAGARSAPSRSR